MCLGFVELGDEVVDPFPGAALGPSIAIGKRNDVDPRWRAASAGPAVFVGTQVDERLRVAVVSGLEHEYIVALSEGAGEAQGQLVGFAAGVDEIKGFKFRRQGRQEAFCLAQALSV